MTMRFAPWPEERVAQLRTFLGEGLSASQAARALSLDGFPSTKASVIGKAHRIKADLLGGNLPRVWTPQADSILREHWEKVGGSQMVKILRDAGFSFTESATRHRAVRITGLLKGRGAPKRPRSSSARTNQPPRVYRPPAPPPEARMIGLLELAPHDCRFPIGDPREAGFGFCAAPASVGRSYCEHHHALAYQPESTGKRNSSARYLMRHLPL